jgi:hypothetical protein
MFPRRMFWRRWQPSSGTFQLDLISNWFLMIPSIATKFQYVNSHFFIFLLTHYMFRPVRAIFRWDIQLDVFKDYFYYNGSIARTQLDIEMLYAYIGTSTRVLMNTGSFTHTQHYENMNSEQADFLILSSLVLITHHYRVGLINCGIIRLITWLVIMMFEYVRVYLG